MKNSVLWNPTNQKLRNAEEDEAGKLAAFRSKFGDSFNLESDPSDTPEKGKKKVSCSR